MPSQGVRIFVLQADYDKMKNMIIREKPTFEERLSTVHTLESEVKNRG